MGPASADLNNDRGRLVAPAYPTCVQVSTIHRADQGREEQAMIKEAPKGAFAERLRSRWTRWHRTTRIAVVVATLWAIWTIFQALGLGQPSRPESWSEPVWVAVVVAIAPLSGLALFFVAWAFMTPFRQRNR